MSRQEYITHILNNHRQPRVKKMKIQDIDILTLISAMAMQGLLANRTTNTHKNTVEHIAIKKAQELLDALSRIEK